MVPTAQGTMRRWLVGAIAFAAPPWRRFYLCGGETGCKVRVESPGRVLSDQSKIKIRNDKTRLAPLTFT